MKWLKWRGWKREFASFVVSMIFVFLVMPLYAQFVPLWLNFILTTITCALLRIIVRRLEEYVDQPVYSITINVTTPKDASLHEQLAAAKTAMVQALERIDQA